MLQLCWDRTWLQLVSLPSDRNTPRHSTLYSNHLIILLYFIPSFYYLWYYLQVDFPEVAKQKTNLILQNKELSQALGTITSKNEQWIGGGKLLFSSPFLSFPLLHSPSPSSTLLSIPYLYSTLHRSPPHLSPLLPSPLLPSPLLFSLRKYWVWKLSLTTYCDIHTPLFI